MKKYIVLFSITLAVVAFASCKYDNAEDLYSTKACDTTVTGYSAFLQPLLAQYCYECHSNSTYTSLGGSRLLEGYINVIDFVNDGSLLSSIKQDGTVIAMPQGKAKLSDCDISKVERWINKGALNN